MSLSISIHVDGYYGLVKGVPNLLALFEKYNLKATFFVNMGREANLLQALKYRGTPQISGKGKIEGRYSIIQKISMALMNRKLGHAHPEILKKMKEKGHEVEPHCWSHLLWSKNFDNLNKSLEIKKMKKAYFRIFEENPKGFVPPLWKFDDEVVKILKEEGFSYLATSGPERKVSEEKGIKIIPLSFNKNIEELLSEGKSEREIIDIYKKEIKKKYVNLYFHADFEGLQGIELFEKVLKLIGKEKTFLYNDL